MSTDGSDAIVFFLVYGVLLLVAIRVFGIRRVAWGLMLFLGLAVTVAFKTLAAVTSIRRY